MFLLGPGAGDGNVLDKWTTAAVDPFKVSLAEKDFLQVKQGSSRTILISLPRNNFFHFQLCNYSFPEL